MVILRSITIGGGGVEICRVSARINLVTVNKTLVFFYNKFF